MSQSLQNQAAANYEDHDFSIHTNRTLIMAILVSAILHACFYFGLFRLGISGQGGISPNEEGENFQSIGIVFLEKKQDNQKIDQAPKNDPQENEPQQKFQNNDRHGRKQSPVSNRPPVPLPMPRHPNRILGPGSIGTSNIAKEMNQSALNDRKSSISSIFRPPAASLGETTFFNIKDSGKKYVYLVDFSGSMGVHNALGVAKAELSSSLDALNSKQLFRVIFFSSTTFEIEIKGRSEDRLYFGTSLNRGLTKRAYSGIRPDTGTSRFEALETALKYKPDILFFLTDISPPRLTAKQLDNIRKINRSQTRIHCIEFGEGGKLGRYNFLEKLAKDNGGSYTYRDTSKFQSNQ